MPFVNLKLVKGQASAEQKSKLIEGITDLIVNIMGRDRDFTVITVDELERENWAIGGKSLKDRISENKIVCFINIKVSKGTTNPEEMSAMMKATKKLAADILGNSYEANYFIMDELNPDGWGFNGFSMTELSKMEQ